jgi:hypothetical protein
MSSREKNRYIILLILIEVNEQFLSLHSLHKVYKMKAYSGCKICYTLNETVEKYCTFVGFVVSVQACFLSSGFQQTIAAIHITSLL